MDNRIVSPEIKNEDDNTLRPKFLKDYVGQTKVKEMIDIYIKAAKLRDEPIDHILLYGPPGLGKTTLAQIIANEMDVSIITTSGPAIEKTGDLAGLLTQLTPGAILFIDEIHRLPRFVEEMLYSAMEDYELDIPVGKDQTSKTIRVDLVPFTLIGATTRYGDLSSPLRDRFGVVERLEYYTVDELKQIVLRTSKIYDCMIDEAAAYELARRSRGTPRIANRLFRRIRDFASVKGDGKITLEICKDALLKLGINPDGLDFRDLKYLRGIVENFKGGPVGLDALAQTIGEEASTIEDVYEPYLLQEGYIQRTPRGRIATEKTYKLLNISYGGML
ncbi:MAG: Holliday junction branch migration DNA helicase RuvB [bacterium]|nr:Holliday junction branch migration DNA helicase RuvB [bacterium]